MAAQTAHHVVNSSQSVGAPPLTDVPDNNDSSASLPADAAAATAAARADNDPIPVANAPSSLQHNPSHTQLPVQAPSLPSHDTSQSDTSAKPATVTANGVYDNAADGLSNDTELDWRRRDSANAPPGRLSSRDRSNSYKKPASFKAVSVTKNFLAKSAVSSPSPKPAVDPKGGSAATPTSPGPSLQKPRLVAKSGTNSRAIALSSAGSAGAPDASKVWNRNRPAPPPQPKQFTDEELKQQYGIHLATRLQADEPGKGSTWADMEDDEDDWAPDTVEWMDGTKSTLQPSEEQKLEPSMDRAVIDEQETAALPNHADATAPPAEQSAPTGPGRTILRPGARASAAQSRPGLVLKNVPEPTAELPKQSTPGPFKSPWATLPPVDKVSPVSFNPPAPEAKPPPVSYRDYKPPPLPSELSPAREIAADTFERSWREHDRGSRELFDSKSGRYEPVRDKRRSSFRGEGNFRPPSVLQRPSHGRPSDSADPGSANRMQFSQDARHWGRRRSSMAIEDDADHQKELAHSPQSAAVSLSDHAPPSVSSSAAAAGPQAPTAHGQEAGRAQAPSPGPNVHEMQHQLMRQRIEANRRRKEEEQAKEEAAKQERIRQKLLALGEPPKRTEAAANPEKHVDAASPEKGHPTPAPTPQEIRKPEPILRPAPSAPLGPATRLDGLGEVPLTKKSSSVAAPETAARRSVAGDVLSGSAQLPAGPRLNANPLQSNAPVKSNSEPSEVPPLNQSKLLPESHRTFDRPQQQWNRANGPIGSGPGPAWNADANTAATKPSANVWGPPSKDKTLGNGAFASDMARIPSISFPSQPTAPPPPGPIAPPSASPKVNVQPSRSTEPSPPVALPQSRLDWHGQPPGFGQRSGFVDQRPQPFFHQAQAPIGAQWNVPGPRDRHLFEEERRHSPIEATLPHQSLRARPQPGDPLGDRWNQRGLRTPDGLGPALGSPALGASLQPMPPPQNLAPGAPVARSSSRFFGVQPERPLAGILPAAVVAPAYTESQTGGTDADLFNNDAIVPMLGRAEPLVKLPKPKPKVKLPTSIAARTPEMERASIASRPATTYGNTQAASLLMRSQPVRFGQQPIVANAEWQNRFDMVTGRKSTSVAAPQSPWGTSVSMPLRSQPVNTSTRPSIDIGSFSNGATVSLPQQIKMKDPALFSEPAHMPSTRVKDDCLYDQPESGSRPVVRFPQSLPSLGWGSTVVSAQNKMLTAARPLAILAESSSEYRFDFSAKICIKTLSMLTPTFKWLSRKNSYNPAARGSGKGPRKPFPKKDRPFERNENHKPSGSTPREKKTWAKPARGNKSSSPKTATEPAASKG